MRSALDEKYANLEWLRTDRGVDVDALFADSADRLRRASDDAAARAVFDRLVRRIGDGHVAINWPAPPSPPPAGAPQPNKGLCATLGYDARFAGRGVAPTLAGYRALPDGNAFPAGTFPVGDTLVGAVRIGAFMPQGYPTLCEGAVAALKIPADQPCDDACVDRILTWAYDRLTTDLQDRATALRAAGAGALLIDLTGNGGGSEWAEAAARIVSPRPLTSASMGFVRGQHWIDHWTAVAKDLRDAARKARRADRQRLLDWAAQADVARIEATPCATCPRTGRAGYATGLVGIAPAGGFANRDWAGTVFSIAQFAYRDSVWTGPLLVLVDQETWSAAEEFAALLQDNRVAAIIGARTGGAGCGHTNGGTPTTLANSHAVLELPDCIRYRADGSNEVNGIFPDVPVAMRANDGDALKARLVGQRLPEAIGAAQALTP